VVGQTMIIVNSLKAAEDLLDVRGGNFSDRPVIQMGGELVGSVPVIQTGRELTGRDRFNNTLSLSQYGGRVRTERKLFHQLFGSQATIKQFAPLVASEIQKLLQNILLRPDAMLEEIGRFASPLWYSVLMNWLLYHRTTGAISLRIGYHIRDGPEQDPYIEMFEIAVNNFAKSTTPAAFFVDIIPARKSQPDREILYAAEFRIECVIGPSGYRAEDSKPPPGYGPNSCTTRSTRSTIMSRSRLYVLHYDEKALNAQRFQAAGTAEPSFASALLEEQVHDDYLIKWAAASIQAGGSETVLWRVEHSKSVT
jgi:hypothetical protein